MSRPLRPLTFLARSAFRPHNLSRVRRGFQTSIPRYDEPSSGQTVRLHQPKRRSRHGIAIKFALNAILCYYVGKLLLGDAGEAIDPRKNKTKSEAGQSEAGQEGKDESDEFQLPDEMPEDATFVPLWIPKESPPYSYKGSDPEWQGYLAFANDRKKAKQVYDSVVEESFRAVDNNQQMSKLLGPPLKTRRIWLDWDYPRRAPPEYDTYGLEIGDEYITLTSRPLSEQQYRKLQRTLLPASVAVSMWASMKTFVQLQLARAKELTSVKGIFGGQGHISQPRPIELNDIVRPIAETEPQGSSGEITRSKAKGAEAKGAEAKGSDKLSVRGSMDSIKAFLQHNLVGKDCQMAYASFKNSIERTWPSDTFVERGQISLLGRVEIIGTQGSAVFSVLALYNPRKSRLEGLTMTCLLMQKHVLRPGWGR